MIVNEENILVITDKEELYDKCENMEQLFYKYYLPLLDKHYSKTYKLQQENARLKDNWKELEKFVFQEQDILLKATSHTYQDSFNKVKFVNSDIFEELKKVENKMKELFKEN